MSPFPILVVFLINILFVRWFILHQKKHAIVANCENQSQNSAVVETHVMKVIAFIITVFSFQFLVIPPILKAIENRNELNRIIEKITSTESGNKINTDYIFKDGNLTINTSISLDSTIGVKVQNYQVGQYQIDRQSNCAQQLKKIIATLDKKILSEIPNDARVNISITGQADGVKCTKNSIYNGTEDIANIKVFSLVLHRNYSRAYKSGKTRLANEDYASLRANDMQVLISELLYERKNIDYNLYSNTTEKVGGSHRWAEINISIIGAGGEHYDGYNFIQKKLYEFVVNI